MFSLSISRVKALFMEPKIEFTLHDCLDRAW
ncbi:hypothetical protein B738_09886, partial [Photorhabdus temperata subsp. temperata M1021]